METLNVPALVFVNRKERALFVAAHAAGCTLALVTAGAVQHVGSHYGALLAARNADDVMGHYMRLVEITPETLEDIAAQGRKQFANVRVTLRFESESRLAHAHEIAEVHNREAAARAAIEKQHYA